MHSQRCLDLGIARMERLVSQLLELERQEGLPGVHGQVAAVDLSACARREIAELGVAGLDRGIALELIAPDQAMMQGDEAGLGALLRNLIDNALRYTPEGGAVSVRVEPSGTDLVLSVDDSGPGIGIDERQRALERFHRGMGHAASGSGLGLSIVQRVVEHHHGSLHLDTSPMGGLRVVVKLPRTAADRLPRAKDSATA